VYVCFGFLCCVLCVCVRVCVCVLVGCVLVNPVFRCDAREREREREGKRAGVKGFESLL
jgi:hypothetical protein